ncbi:MAG: oligopeptide transporter permease, partial [Cocleimonas sp.]
MWAYISKRILGVIPTLFIIVTISFFLIRMAPGGPFDSEREIPPEIAANLEAVYHLDEPLWKQYGYYIVNVLKG